MPAPLLNDAMALRCLACYFADPFAESLNLAVVEGLVFPTVRRNGVCFPCCGIAQPSS